MAYTPEQQMVVSEANSGRAASLLSPEAQYYRAYGTFQQSGPVSATNPANIVFSTPNVSVDQIQPTSPLNLPNLPADTLDYAAILRGTAPSLPVAPNPESEKLKASQDAITSALTELRGQEAYSQQQSEAFGLPESQRRLKDLTAQLLSVNTEAQQQVLEYDKGGKPAILTAAANIDKQNIERDRAIKALGLSAQIQALQGNVELATQQAQRAVDLKYKPILANLDLLEKQLQYSYKTFDAAEKKIADSVSFQNSIKLRQLDAQIAQDKQNATYALNAMADNPGAGIKPTDTPEVIGAKVGKVTPIRPTGPIVPVTPKEKPLTVAQLTAKGYYDRVVEADRIITAIGGKFTGIMSYVSQYVPNVLKSSERQQYEQAQRNFINAILRPESGAAISESEFTNASKQYFPQPGDSKAVVAQKSANRQTKIQGLAAQSGQTSSGSTDLRTKYNY